MKKTAPKAVAIALATAFTMALPGLSGPAMADNAAPATSGDQIEKTPAALRGEEYKKLQAELDKVQKENAARKAQIATDLKKADPNISDDELAIKTEQIFSTEMQRQAEAEWRSKTDSNAGAGYTDLPGVFSKAVRGCTVDGFVYRMPYKLTYNFDELGGISNANTPEDKKSLFYRMVKPDAEKLLGVSGTRDFLGALQAMDSSIHTSMQSISGHLIDEVNSDFIVRPIFNELMGIAVSKVTQEIKDKYGVTVVIHTEQPKRQGDLKCAAEAKDPNAPPVSADKPLITPQDIKPQ